MSQGPLVRVGLANLGLRLPCPGPVNVAALFYREADVGDACGYYQALGDALQTPEMRKGRMIRNGIGVIVDDKQIRSWDGTRLLVDRANPRIEITVTPLDALDAGGKQSKHERAAKING